MQFLFLHQNFPGQFLHLVRQLVAENRHDIVFLTEPNANVMAGVRKVPYVVEGSSAGAHPVSREFDNAARRAEAVARTCAGLKQLGFTPNIVIGHHGWGEMLNIRDVWADVPMLGYFEFFYQLEGADVGFDPEFPVAAADHARIRAKNATNLLALQLGAAGQTPTDWQLSTYPAWARQSITVLREGVDLDACRPDPAARTQALEIGGAVIAPSDALVTYVSRDLEPYRGFHVMMRALPQILRENARARVVLVGGDGVSYGAAPASGTWRALFTRELGAAFDADRVLFPGRIPYTTYLRLLQRSDAHVYLTYPFVASWSLREALAMGCAVIASDTPPVRDFVAHERTGLLTSFFDPAALAGHVLRVLEDRGLASSFGRAARAYAETNLSMADYLAAYGGLIARMTAA
ncbi:MAG: glycosyltransferase [Acetobacteraceae bacterium]|nr:glycosyltransferase [Acetobacteraceae bacterium]